MGAGYVFQGSAWGGRPDKLRFRRVENRGEGPLSQTFGVSPHSYGADESTALKYMLVNVRFGGSTSFKATFQVLFQNLSENKEQNIQSQLQGVHFLMLHSELTLDCIYQCSINVLLLQSTAGTQ